LAFESESRTDPGPDYSREYIAGQNFEFVIGDCWLLFVYEVLRTFHSSKQFSALSEETKKELEEIFRLVSLVRMPIAKHEAAKTRKGTSYISTSQFASCTMNSVRQVGVEWPPQRF
jgi:hypothetical protein